MSCSSSESSADFTAAGAAAPAAIAALSADDLARVLPAFGALLLACVRHGASVGFVMPVSAAETESFWRDRVLPPLRAGTKLVLGARAEGQMVGTVQLNLDMPANQPHRADVSKLLVHPDWRRRGIARALMAELEVQARDRGRTLLTLDTRTGDHAEPLYASLGYATAGVIPGYCCDPVSPDRLDATTIMYKAL